MRLRTIELDQFRKFDRRVRLEGLGDGVNVLCGPNEHGKSTVLAALRAVLFERHNSRTESIRGYQHRRGSTAPAVALEFEHDGTLHRIEKRFLSRPSARLVSAGAAYDGDAAEERLQRLLGVSVTSRAARDAAQTASIWGALLVAQGDSFAQARLGEGARSTLSECLEAELGSVSGGAATGRLLKRVQDLLAALLDGYGRPRDRYKAAVAEEEAARAGIATLEERGRLLRGDLDAAVAARNALAREEDPVRAEQIVEQLASARRHRDAVLGYRNRLAEAESGVRLALSAHDEALAEQTRRTARAGALAAAGQALSGLLAAEAEARARDDAARAAMSGRRDAHDDAVRRQDEAERVLRRAAAGLEAADQAALHRSAAVGLARAEAEAARASALSESLSRLRLDEAAMRGLQAAELADRGNRAALQAQATLVELCLDVAAELLVEGAAPETLPPGPVRLSLTRPAELLIPGAGRLCIAPAGRDREKLHAAAGDSARALRRALDAAGCADLAEAERRLGERRLLAASLDQAQRALALLLAGAFAGTAAAGTAPGSAPGLDALRRHVASLQAGLDQRVSALGPDAGLPERSDVAALHDAALREAERLRDAALAAHGALLAPDAERDRAAAMLRQAEFDRRDRAADCARLSAEQAAAEQAESADALAERLRQAQEDLSARRQALSALSASAPEGTPEMADATIRRLEEVQSNRRVRIGALRVELARLESRIAQEEGVGLDEQIEAAIRLRDTAGREHAHHRREAAILLLLRDTLLQADREARERYLAPLMTRLSPYLQALFPRARLSLRDDFQITGLSRLDAVATGSEPDDETFDSLSHGTREQIAILARLAFADMLLQSGRPAFLVLDDALAFADHRRMERMFDILTDAGRRMQILVLTCREDLATGLGGTRVTLREAAPAG